MSGGVPCGEWPDLKLARRCFVRNIREGEKTIADRAYKDDQFFITQVSHPDYSYRIKTLLARHEKVNGRLKAFKVLSTPFRHSLSFHIDCFNAVANIVQMNIKNGDVLFRDRI